jgi:type IV secretory pathway VirB2 component (pilin)
MIFKMSLPSIKKLLPLIIAAFTSLFFCESAHATAFTAEMCNINNIVTGTAGKVFAAFAIVSVGIGFFTGKVSWGLMIGTCVGIGLIFGAPSLISAVSGQSTFVCNVNQSYTTSCVGGQCYSCPAGYTGADCTQCNLGYGGASGTDCTAFAAGYAASANGGVGCAAGYARANDGTCQPGCNVPANLGISDTTVPAGSGERSCAGPKYTGKISYTCASTTFTKTGGSCACAGTFSGFPACTTCIAGYIGANCDRCDTAANYTMIGGVCQPGCTVTPGLNAAVTSVMAGPGKLGCASGYAGGIDYNCVNGSFTISPTSSCLINSCNFSKAGVSALSVAAGSTSVNCDQTGFTGTIGYTCVKGGTLTIGTPAACACDAANGYTGASCNTCLAGFTKVVSVCQKNCVLTATTIPGIAATTINAGSPAGTLSCSVSGYTTATLTYTGCSNGSLTGLTPSSCGCDTANNYSNVGGVCQLGCDLSTQPGMVAGTKVAAGATGTKTCSGAAYNTSTANPLVYECSTAGVLKVTTPCACASNYAWDTAKRCISTNCTVGNGVNGVASGTTVSASSTSVACNVAGYVGTLGYTCVGGTFTATSPTCTAIKCNPVATGIAAGASQVDYTTLSKSLACNAAGYTGSINYTCTGTSAVGTFAATGACTAVTCSIPVQFGVANATSVDYAPTAQTKNCSGNNINILKTLTYTCSATGAITVDTSACICNSGYYKDSSFGCSAAISLNLAEGATKSGLSRSIRIISASYGPASSNCSGADVRVAVQDYVSSTGSIVASNAALGGDPYPYTTKKLCIWYVP